MSSARLHFTVFWWSLIVGSIYAFFLQACALRVSTIGYEELKAYIEDQEAMKTTVIIDVREQEEWAAGYIQDAQNIAFNDFIDTDGNLIANGEALTSVVTDKQITLITYGTGSEEAMQFAQQAVRLGYRNVLCYTGGTADWERNGEYYIIAYEAFKEWHTANCPFDDAQYLIDLYSPEIYAGVHPVHPGGHIPGAINIWSSLFVSGDDLINGGNAFTEVVINKDAKVVMYCGGFT